METTGVSRKVLDLQAITKELAVIADLPKNSISLAIQAQEAGVDAIMVNVEGEEPSSPGHFGSYELHQAYIKDILSTLSIPCGIFIGGARPLTPDYWEIIVSGEFSFVDMYAHAMPLFVLNDSRLRKVVAISTGYILEQVRSLSETKGVEAIEVALVPPQARGNPFSILDFVTLDVISKLSSRTIILRTQKKMTDSDLGNITLLGVKGIIIDPCVLAGPEEAYRHEVASFSPRRGTTE